MTGEMVATMSEEAAGISGGDGLEGGAGRGDQARAGALRRRARALWCTGRVAKTTIWPGIKVGTTRCSPSASKLSRASAPSSTIAAPIPVVVIRASNVTLCHRLYGTCPTARSPRGARARSRVKVVGVAVSSSKTKRCGAMAVRASRHCGRAASSRSAAIRAFW